jgi:hypothetical protein
MQSGALQYTARWCSLSASHPLVPETIALGATNLNDIARPKNPPGHFERPLDCEEALEAHFAVAMENLVEAAVNVGWSADEAEEALFSLSQNRRLAQILSDETGDGSADPWDSSGGRTDH